MAVTGLKVVKKADGYYVINAQGTNISGPYADISKANSALASAEDKAIKGTL